MKIHEEGQELNTCILLALSTYYLAALGTEALPVLQRRDECLDHLCIHEVTVEGVQLAKPEVEAGGIRIAAKVPKVLHRHEGRVKLARPQLLSLGHGAEHGRARHGRSVQSRHERVAEGVGRGQVAADLATGELRCVEVDVGTPLAEIRELRGQRRAVALWRVPLRAEGAAHARGER